MSKKPGDEPLTVDTFRRAVESFGQSLANAIGAARPLDKDDMLRKLAAELRVSAAAMEAESPETARALALTADKIEAESKPIQ